MHTIIAEAPAAIAARSYFQRRIIDELGVTEAENSIELYNPGLESPYDEMLRPYHIFEEDVNTGDILINIWSVSRNICTYEKPGTGKSGSLNDKEKVLQLRRLANPTDDRKYTWPKGTKPEPFFPPGLTNKFEKKEEIPTLYLTEGFIKAYIADRVGIDCVGLASISQYKRDGKLYKGIIDIIVQCKVRTLVVLADGDINKLSEKALSEPGYLERQKDITERPMAFYNFGNGVREAAEGLDVKILFGHIKSDCFEDYPKGLDDLVIAAQKADKLQELLEAMGDDTIAVNRYIHKINISVEAKKLYAYLALKDVDVFYLTHQDVIKEYQFTFKGTTYRYDEGKEKCLMIRPADANNYIRVGDQYYEIFQKPNFRGEMITVMDARKKETISEDHGKKILTHIRKFKSFVNVPSHAAFSPIINNCYNLYHPLEHEPEEGSVENTLAFMKHIFGSDKVPGTDIDSWEIGLDYLQLLYLYPTQILPILCLYSPENHSGKSLFAEKYMRALFSQNAVTIGNDDLNSEFNSVFLTRLVVCIDEVAIDKKPVIEKVKRLSTAETTVINAKNRQQFETDIFCKFIMCTNNKNFIQIGENDIRFWIRQIPMPKELDPNLLEKLIEEIPAFLYFLSGRKMVTKKESRMWFDPKLLETKILHEVRRTGDPKPAKELRVKMREIFLATGIKEMMVPLSDLKRDFLPKFEEDYIETVLVDHMKILRVKDESGKTVVKTGTYYIETKAFKSDEDGQMLDTHYEKRRFNGRPFLFTREMFVDPADEPDQQSDDDLELPF
jgi:hypothetical protein